METKALLSDRGIKFFRLIHGYDQNTRLLNPSLSPTRITAVVALVVTASNTHANPVLEK